jgi:hypothetical protein
LSLGILSIPNPEIRRLPANETAPFFFEA